MWHIFIILKFLLIHYENQGMKFRVIRITFSLGTYQTVTLHLNMARIANVVQSVTLSVSWGTTLSSSVKTLRCEIYIVALSSCLLIPSSHISYRAKSPIELSLGQIETIVVL